MEGSNKNVDFSDSLKSLKSDILKVLLTPSSSVLFDDPNSNQDTGCSSDAHCSSCTDKFKKGGLFNMAGGYDEMSCNNNKDFDGDLINPLSEGMVSLNYGPLSDVRAQYEEVIKLLNNKSASNRIRETKMKQLLFEIDLAIAEEELRLLSARKSREFYYRLKHLIKPAQPIIKATKKL